MPPNSVVKLVESASTMSPALVPFGGIHRQAVEFAIAGLGERMGPLHIDRLPGQDLDRCRRHPSQLVMRQMQDGN